MWLRFLLSLLTLFAPHATISALAQEKQGARVIATDVTHSDMPRIIFIPGIFGSRLYACGQNPPCDRPQPNCQLIFGDFEYYHPLATPPDLTHRQGTCYQHEVLRSIPSRIWRSIPIYNDLGSYFERHNTLYPFFYFFSYDWRLGNVNNSAELERKLCALLHRTTRAPVYFVAHSMGGLLLRAWFKQYAHAGCLSKSQARVQEVVFIATPHLGSPKTLQVARSGYSLFVDYIVPDNWRSTFSGLDGFTKALNRAFVDFDSVYELLPVLAGGRCAPNRASEPGLRSVPPPIAVEGISHSGFNLFDSRKWQDLALPVLTGYESLKSSYYRDSLPKRLEGASNFFCVIASWENLKRVPRVVFVVGTGDANTFAGYKLDSSKAGATFRPEYTVGDGTVPAYSASYYVSGINAQVVMLAHDHVAIAASAEVLGILSEWRRHAMLEHDIRLAESSVVRKRELLDKIAHTKEFLPYPITGALWQSSIWRRVSSLNEAALREHPELNSVLDDPTSGADAFDVAVRALTAADLSGEPRKKASNFLLAAEYLTLIGRPQEALRLLGAADELLENDIFLRMVRAEELARLARIKALVTHRTGYAAARVCVDRVC